MNRYQRFRTWLFHILPYAGAKAGYLSSVGSSIVGEVINVERSRMGRAHHRVLLRTYVTTVSETGETVRTSWTRWVLARELIWFRASTPLYPFDVLL